MMNVYTNGKSGYAYSSQMQALNPKDTNVAGGVQKILISSSIGGSTTYFVVAMIKYGEEYSVKFFKLKDTSLSWVQDILSASTLEVGGGYLTKNGLYLSVALADRKMSLYQYDSSTDKFIIAQQVWSFYAVPSSSFID